MKKAILSICIILCLSFLVKADHVSISSGLWGEPDVWLNDEFPPTTIPNNHTKNKILIANPEHVIELAGELTVNYNQNPGFTIEIFGWLTLGTLNANNALDIIVRNGGNLLINEDMVVNNGLDITVEDGGTFTVLGDVQLRNNASIHLDGLMEANSLIGQTENTNYLTGSGTLIVNEFSGINYDNFNGIIIVEGVTLPVELLSFSAESKENFIEVYWTTASETNNMGYEVQRLKNESWETIGFVPGNYNHNGLLHYNLTDASPLEGINYYRLKQMDLDGAFEFFGPVAAWHGVEFPEAKIQIMKTSGNTYIVVPGYDSGQLEVFDIHGRLQMSAVTGGKVPVNLGKGTYIVRFFNGYETLTAKFIL